MRSGTTIRQSLKHFQNPEMFSGGKQEKAGNEVVSLRSEEAGLKLGWVIAKFIAALNSLQPK